MTLRTRRRLINAVFIGVLVLLASIAVIVTVGHNVLKSDVESAEKTNRALALIQEVNRTCEDADGAGRLVLTGERTPSDLTPKRQACMTIVAELKTSYDAGTSQYRNVEALRTALAARFAAQDASISTVIRENGTLILDSHASARSSLALIAVEQAVIVIRDEELTQLFEKSTAGIDTRQSLIYMAYLVLLILFFVSVLKWAMSRDAIEAARKVTNLLKENALHNSTESGYVQFNIEELERLVDEIEQRSTKPHDMLHHTEA